MSDSVDGWAFSCLHGLRVEADPSIAIYGRLSKQIEDLVSHEQTKNTNTKLYRVQLSGTQNP